MKKEDEKYNALVKKLQHTRPEIMDKEAFTQSILDAIPDSAHKTSGIFLWLRPVLSTAAAFLFGLFLYQQRLEVLDNHSIPPNYPAKIMLSEKVPDCNSKSESEKINRNSFLKQYLCYIKHTASENRKSKLFLLSQISKYQRIHSNAIN